MGLNHPLILEATPSTIDGPRHLPTFNHAFTVGRGRIPSP